MAKPSAWGLLIALPFLYAACFLFGVVEEIEYRREETLGDWGFVALAWLIFLLPTGAVVARVGYVLGGDLKWRLWARVLEVVSILVLIPIVLMFAPRPEPISSAANGHQRTLDREAASDP